MSVIDRRDMCKSIVATALYAVMPGPSHAEKTTARLLIDPDRYIRYCRMHFVGGDCVIDVSVDVWSLKQDVLKFVEEHPESHIEIEFQSQ